MKIKILIGASLFIFFAFVVTVVGSGLVIKSIRQNQTPSTNNNSTNINGTQNSNQTSGITLQEVAKHNTSIDCWMIINNDVYNFTSYLSAHPGGASIMVQYCGKDGSVAYATKDRNPGRSHSQTARELLASYFIGSLGSKQFNSTTSATTKTTSSTNTNPTSTPSPIPNNTSTSITLTMQQVAQHSSASDCWMVISNNVYSLSSYLSSHPGGANTIISYCGKDGTVAFDSKGNSGHSSFAHSLLAQYLVGQIGQSVTTQQLNQTNQNIQQQSPPPNNRGDDD